MQKLRHILMWLDTHALEVLAYFLVLFIPLYPKLPLFDAIPGYIVRVRVEDIVLLITGVIWLVQFLRKKITWQTPLTWAIAAYAVAGLLSTLSAMFITQSVPLQFVHVAKTTLHYVRYLEYFFIFFVVVTSLKTPKQFKTLFFMVLTTLALLAVYGYGQRYYYWPVYSTMNREFSKGIRLVLDEHARVQSTFGGHYDLAAYLVVIMPIILAGIYLFTSKRMKALFLSVFLGGLWLLTQTSSRSSFLGFIIASYIVIGLFAWYKPTWWRSIKMFVTHSAVYSILILFFVLQFGNDMYERFLQTLKAYPQLHDKYHTLNKQRKDFVASGSAQLISYVLTDEQVEMIKSKFRPKQPENSITTTEALEPVLVASDTQPVPARPSDVTVSVPDVKLVATQSADGSITITKVQTERTWSDTALRQGLSAGIRYDTLWPRAIAGFKKNPLLGSGYATLTKESTYIFTEAESTDNNFLRTLGETGALGFVTFYGVICLAIKLAWDVVTASKDKYQKIFAIGFIGGAVGLLVNAFYIDVFAASKVAFTFWAVTGVITAAYLSVPKAHASTTGSISALAQALTPKHAQKKKHKK